MSRKSANRAGGDPAVSRLTALVPPQVCAAALGRSWPDDLDGQVRCIDEGTRSLGLAYCCSPWSAEAEDAALRAELGDPADPAAASQRAPVRDPAVGAHPNLKSFPSYTRKTGSDFDGDAVVAGLARVPGAPPVLGLVSGPLTWGIRVGPGPVLEDAVDAASDLACARVRRLADRGVECIAVLETGADGSEDGAVDDLMVEAHRPIVRSAVHLRVEVLLVSTHSASNATARLAYERWVGPDRCADGLAFLPAAAFASIATAARCLDRQAIPLASADAVLTAPLGADADPGVVRHAAELLAALRQEDPA